MSMKDLMLEQLAIARRIVTDGHENIPAWRNAQPFDRRQGLPLPLRLLLLPLLPSQELGPPGLGKQKCRRKREGSRRHGCCGTADGTASWAMLSGQVRRLF